MVNCSRSVDYDAHVSELRATLKMRGYPDEWLPHVPYNADTRQSYLDRYMLVGGTDLHDSDKTYSRSK